MYSWEPDLIFVYENSTKVQSIRLEEFDGMCKGKRCKYGKQNSESTYATIYRKEISAKAELNKTLHKRPGGSPPTGGSKQVTVCVV